MNSAPAPHVHTPGPGLASWYTPGRSDGFGDRLLMFDNTDATSLELLRFRRELVTTGFENALRDRVEHLSHFRHPSFSLVRAAVHLDDQDLTLVSAHTSGQRLSELPAWKLRKGLHPAVVTWIVREITPALAALQGSGPFVAHGALNTDRIVATSDGRLCITEHALGAALRRLRLTPGALWRQFGLLAPVDDRGLVRIDARTDVVQLGTIALSLLLARPVTLHGFDRELPALLDEFSAHAGASPSVFAAPLRVWLERALQLAPRSYRSAKDAQEGLRELPVPVRSTATLGTGASYAPDTSRTPDAPGSSSFPEMSSVTRLETMRPRRLQSHRELPPSPVEPSVAAKDPLPPADPTGSAPHETAERKQDAPGGPRWKRAYTIAISVTLGAIALGEAAIIARLGGQPTVVSVAAPVTPAPARSSDSVPRIDTTSLVPATIPAIAPIVNSDADAIARTTARQRSGGVRWSTPIELTVLQGDRVLGSTADGPIVMPPGTHEVDLVNSALGFRSRQTVTIRSGIIAAATVPAAMGRININAQPWAQVSIDDRPIGDTPLANVSVPLGPHQITFRHPQMGERRETVMVRADTITRVSTAFDR